MHVQNLVPTCVGNASCDLQQLIHSTFIDNLAYLQGHVVSAFKGVFIQWGWQTSKTNNYDTTCELCIIHKLSHISTQ